MPFFKLPDFILSVQLLQLPKKKEREREKIEPQPFCITFKKVLLAEKNLGLLQLFPSLQDHFFFSLSLSSFFW